jgi:hypothetical protein
MKSVSQNYKLGLTQASLEFLDVDIIEDTMLFVDPHAFRYVQNDWARECTALLQSFFGEVLSCIRAGKHVRARELLAQLSEPNEAHLGLSDGASRGSGLGPGLAEVIWESLRSSKAVSSGLLSDIEDTVLFVEGIGPDRISDMTINIVRSQLIEFTQEMCRKYGIKMHKGVDSGVMWDRRLNRWYTDFVELPIPKKSSSKLLLIPRAVVRRTSTFDPGDYLRNFVMPKLREDELFKQSGLVQKRKSGERYVTNKSIYERDGLNTKQRNTEATLESEEILQNYRKSKKKPTKPLSHDELAAKTNNELPDWDKLLADVKAVPPGAAGATDYHHAVERLLTALLYPSLDLPEMEVEIHEGRKRIDITYVNVAAEGFFRWLVDLQKVPAGQIVVEVKNYSGQIKNPEFDQINGRFSNLRGQVGLLCYRGFDDDKASVVKHCRDAALDQRGYVIALDDSDLEVMVEAVKLGDDELFKYLHRRFSELI